MHPRDGDRANRPRDDGRGSGSDEGREGIRRRTFLVATGGAGAATLAGVGSAQQGGGQVSDEAFVRHELNDRGLGNAQTDTPPFMPRLTTYDGRQYFAYWTHDGDMVVAARDLPGGDWTQHRPGIQIDERNGHWTPALGVGPDGHLYLNYNTRSSEIRWRRSENPADVTAFGEERIGMTGQNESSVTYMEFTRLLDGTLLAGYREGVSGAGNWMMNRWNAEAGEWEPLQHPLIDGEGEFNSYMWNLIQSDDGTLHYFFNWRETPDVQSNGDLSYARSTDGGETWERSDGTPYDLPMTLGSTEIVDPIEPDSNLINQGWASYDPRTNAPHVTYYRDDADGNTQVYHAYLDEGEWVTEPATDRTTDIDLGGPGVVASPIGRMGIVVDDDGDVHILTRDFENGSWPLLVEKLDGEWQTSVLYRRNLTWSDVHIDRERWRQDRVLSFVDVQQNVGDVPWSEHSLIGITDIHFDNLDRSGRGIDLGSDPPEDPAEYASTDAVADPVTASGDSFADTNAALAITETTVPATPVYARATATLADDSDADAASVRVKIQGEQGQTFGDPAEVGGGDGTAQTAWAKVPQAFRAGFVNVQVASGGGETARLDDVRLVIGYDEPTGVGDAVAPSGGGSR